MYKFAQDLEFEKAAAVRDQFIIERAVYDIGIRKRAIKLTALFYLLY